MSIYGRIPLGMNISKVRDFYLKESSPEIKRRKKIIALALLGTGIAGITLLRQTGLIKHLPDIPYHIFGANEVTTSLKAYEFGLPDASLALTSYGLIMVLAGYEGDKKLHRKKFVDLLLLGVVSLNSLAAVQYFLNMVFEEKKTCLYCISATLTNLSMFPPALAQINRRGKES